MKFDRKIWAVKAVMVVWVAISAKLFSLDSNKNRKFALFKMPVNIVSNFAYIFNITHDFK